MPQENTTEPRRRRRRADDPSPSQEIAEDSSSESTFPGGIETLLPGASRKELPEIPRVGRKSLLIDMINHAPDLYSKLILLIQQGVYFHVAAECVGINEHTLHDWAVKGNKDLQEKKDTYYSRFYLDIRRAVAMARADCEMVIKKRDPKKWLSLGPGRLFGNQWTKDTPAALTTNDQPQDAIEAAFSPPQLEAPEETEELTTDTGQTIQVLDVSSTDQLEALEVLEKAGLGQFSEEYKTALRKQKGVAASEEPESEPEVPQNPE